jgi:hypothetical protein
MPLRLANCGTLGGDNEMVPTLKLLAERHPDVDFLLVGRNSGEQPRDVGLPANVVNPWTSWAPEVRRRINERGLNYQNLSVEDHLKLRDLLDAVTGDTIADLDGVVMWLGQHGTTNSPLPSIKDRSKLTKPYDWANLYGSYLLRGINRWRDADPVMREEVLLNADARNCVKYRDAKWPWQESVLAQYNQWNNVKHERYGDDQSVGDAAYHFTHAREEIPGIWSAKSRSVYARLEISSLVPGTPFGDAVKFSDDFDRPYGFGVVANETRRQVNPAKSRVNALKKWVLPLEPDFVYGHWSADSIGELGRRIEPISITEYPQLLRQVKSTITLPSSGAGWATAKPWESFAAGVVCFFHPDYDDQNHVLGDAPAELRDFLRVQTPQDFRRRITTVTRDEETWRWAVELQRAHFERAVAELHYLKLIEERLELTWTR